MYNKYLEKLEYHVIKEKLTGGKLDDFLTDNYRTGRLKAAEAIRLQKKFENTGKS